MVVNVSCCCFSSRSGTILIGVLSLAAAIYNLINLAKEEIQIQAMHETMADDGGFLNLNTHVTSIGLIIYTIINGFVSCLLLNGVFQRIPHHLLPWIGLNFGNLVVSISISLGSTISTCMYYSSELFIYCIVATALVTVLGSYIWLVVYSFYKELSTEQLANQTFLETGRHMAPPPSYDHQRF